MKSLTSEFVTSAQNLLQCPELNLPEIALIGRSNVGKSSFINALANNRKLAKTSNTPGKTRLINLFNFSNKFIVADLPGYGYAKVSKDTQDQWQKNMEKYLLNRNSLVSLIQFIDARHAPQKNDLQMIEWIRFNKLECFAVATKIDNIKRSDVLKTVKNIEKITALETLPFSINNAFFNDKIFEKINSLISQPNRG